MTNVRAHAVQLNGLVRLARQVAASKLDLSAGTRGADLTFVLRRGDSVLMRGTVDRRATTVQPN